MGSVNGEPVLWRASLGVRSAVDRQSARSFRFSAVPLARQAVQVQTAIFRHRWRSSIVGITQGNGAASILIVLPSPWDL